MQKSIPFKINSKEKWRLALSIVAIYLPIRIYISNPQLSMLVIESKTPFWLVELLINILFFRFWINIIEYIQYAVQSLAEQNTLKLPVTTTTFFIGTLLAVSFNFFFVIFWVKMEYMFLRNFDISIVRTEAEMNFFYLRQKTKANTGLTVMAMLVTFLMTSNRRIQLHMQQVQLNSERQERENMQAQLIALKNQLSPHFLFNSFSILTSLIETDTAQSVKFVKRLSASYRHILEVSGMDTVPIGKELEFVGSYLALLEARFEEKFKVMIDIPEAARSRVRIAPLTFQLLIENAMKHNQMTQEHPLVVSIKIEAGYLTVNNPVRLRPASIESPGTGLANIVNRYALLSKIPVVIEKTDYDFTVKIPLLT